MLKSVISLSYKNYMFKCLHFNGSQNYVIAFEALFVPPKNNQISKLERVYKWKFKLLYRSIFKDLKGYPFSRPFLKMLA